MAVLWFGVRQVIDGKLTAGELSSFIVYAIFVSGNVGQLAGVFASLMQVRPYFPSCAAQQPPQSRMRGNVGRGGRIDVSVRWGAPNALRSFEQCPAGGDGCHASVPEAAVGDASGQLLLGLVCLAAVDGRALEACHDVVLT